MIKKRLLFKLIGIILIAVIAAACTPKKTEPDAAGISENVNDPIILAHWAFSLIMQLEGRDDKDPAVAAELTAIEERIRTFSEPNQQIYYAELERLYIGDVTDIDESADVDIPHFAALWVNGTMQPLSNDRSVAHSVYVSGSDVYAAGRVLTGWRDGPMGLVPVYSAALWINGVQNIIGAENSEVLSVYVSGSNIYSAGYQTRNGITVATLWIGTEASQILSNQESKANFVSVDENSREVYAAGYEKAAGKNDAIIWIDGVKQNLTDGNYQGEAVSVFVSNGDVYVLGSMAEFHPGDGYGFFEVTVWKNGLVQEGVKRDFYPGASSIFVSDGNVYVAGYDYDMHGGSDDGGRLWVNGTPQKFTGQPLSVFVSGSDVYMAGHISNDQHIEVAALWKNGIAQNLTDGTRNAKAQSVFVYGGNVYAAGYR
ncbi:MAG: hypothetical protein FWD40_06615 [Treponema sp.]|nr:hypothetical protein [Treponema sp.]